MRVVSFTFLIGTEERQTVKFDLLPGRLWWWSHELADRFENDSKLLVILLLERLECRGQVCMSNEELTQPNKGAHDLDVDLNGSLAIEKSR